MLARERARGRVRGRCTKKLDTDSDLVSEYRLAERLHMTVTRLRAEMPADELTGWIAFDEYERRRREEEEKARAPAPTPDDEDS